MAAKKRVTTRSGDTVFVHFPSPGQRNELVRFARVPFVGECVAKHRGPHFRVLAVVHTPWSKEMAAEIWLEHVGALHDLPEIRRFHDLDRVRGKE